MINDNLLNGTATLLAGGAYNVISHLAYGSTTGTITSADLITSGEFDRDAITGASVAANTVTYVCTRSSAVANNEIVNCIGFHNSAILVSSGNLQANMLVASLIHTTDFDIEVELVISVQRV